MKILVTGVKGMLGTKLMAVLHDHDITGLDKDNLDITDEKAIVKALSSYKPEVIINSAAFTKVDECETKIDLAFSVNAKGPANLAGICKKSGIKLVQISTDYVFDGTGSSPYLETDKTNPLSIYGNSKLAGEENIKALMDDYLIVRTEWLYGENGPNFVETILRIAGEKDELRIVNDQRGAPTYTKDLALAIKTLIDNNCRGIYHAANSGSCTWYDFAVEILKLYGLEKKIVPITTEEVARPAKRPVFSVFNCEKLKSDTGFVLRDWKEALAEYMAGRQRRE